MTEIVTVLVVAAALAALWWSARAATTICVVRVERGSAKIVSGKIAPRILVDLEDVVKKPSVASAKIRITKSSGLAEVTMSGDLTSAQKQQIRNVIGSVPLAKLKNG